MNSTINSIKNIIWAACIVVCLAAVGIGLIIASFNRYRSVVKEDYAINLGSTIQSGNDVIQHDTDDRTGSLRILPETPDAGDGYVSTLTFLCDSSFIGLRDLGIVSASQVWGSSSGALSMDVLTAEKIKFPNDGSEILPANAAMVSRPGILMILIGMDGLTRVSENAFKANYESLISDIKSSSPETKIVCCSLCSISETYSANDGYSAELVAGANEWVQYVCKVTGCYYLDVAASISESAQMLTRFAASNGRSVNRLGLQTAIEYIRTHALQ